MMSLLKKTVPVIVLFVLWGVASQYSSPLFLPEPSKVFDAFFALVGNGMLTEGLFASFTRITIATMLSAVISIPLGMMVANYKIADQMVTPLTSAMRFVPVTALYPMLMMWFGIGETMKIVFLFAATIFYFLPTVILCIKEVNSDLIDTAYTMGMSKLQVMLQVMLPAALPSIAQSFLMMYGIGWTYVIIAEVINSQVGLGHIMNVASARGRTDMVFVVVITIVTVSYLFDTFGKLAIKKMFKWKFAREVND